MHPHLPSAPQHFHRTTTFATAHHPVWPHAQLPDGPHWAQAACRCGWTECAESRHDARVLARHHRRFAAPYRGYLPGWASRIGPRACNADAVGLHVSITGHEAAWAVADGIGDDDAPAHAAGTAAAVAAYVASRQGSIAGLLAASRAIGCDPRADTVMAVATPHGDGGWDIAWTGDCRAYEYDPATGRLTQLTVDHTRGQEPRDLAARSTARLDRLEALAAAQDHVVLSSVGSACEESVGHTVTEGPRGRLLLTTDGIHQSVPARSIARAARMFSHPASCAARLALAARYFGSRDNATALVLDPALLP